MQVLNRGKRSFIVDPSSVISGGEISYDKRVVYINPGDKVELQDDAAKKLAAGYQDIVLLEEAKKARKKE